MMTEKEATDEIRNLARKQIALMTRREDMLAELAAIRKRQEKKNETFLRIKWNQQIRNLQSRQEVMF